jgi:hypothetical protein
MDNSPAKISARHECLALIFALIIMLLSWFALLTSTYAGRALFLQRRVGLHYR